MRAEGVTFCTGIHVGHDATLDQMRREYNAICLTGGARKPRGLGVPGRDLDGIHFAMDFLTQQNRRNAGISADGQQQISAKDRHVIVIGGGDTGSDCVGTSRRQGAKSVTQIEILPRPPKARSELLAWPRWPMILRTSSSHEEGCERDWSVSTKAFLGSGGKLEKLQLVRLEWSEPDESGRSQMQEMPGSEFTIEADLVLLAMGFLHPEHEGMLANLGVELDERGNVKAASNYMTSVRGVFAAGDMRRGQSLVVWAIYEGREAAHHIDAFLMGYSDLPLRSL
jgi:glutamate synthase (NADPH/NADH) small chain